MKITIKTLKGEQFQIDVDPSDTILAIKEKVTVERADFPVDRQKLIHSGKVLKDTATVEESGFKENDFLVCMVSKEVSKPVAPRPAPAAVPMPAPAAVPFSSSSPSRSLAQAPAPPAVVELSEEAVNMLTAMGFREVEARAALAAARGNGDLAVEFLMNGIPEQLMNTQPFGSTLASAVVNDTGPLAQLRQHPQFVQLQRLVQSNPASLPQVLEAIGQQDANLLEAIHANHDGFVAMMNEPIVENQPAPATFAPAGFGAPTGGPSPAQLVQMLQGLPEPQRAQAAASMGMSVEQLQQFTQALSSLPPEQLQNMLMGEGMGGAPPGAQVIRLTPDELAAVRRLQELGYSEQQSAQAFIACDRNETLAANFLMDGGAAGDFGDDYGA